MAKVKAQAKEKAPAKPKRKTKTDKHDVFFRYIGKTRWAWILAAIVLGLISFVSNRLSYHSIFEEARQKLEQISYDRSREIYQFLNHNYSAVMQLAHEELTKQIVSQPPNQLDTKAENHRDLVFTHLISELQRSRHFLKIMLIGLDGTVIYSHKYKQEQAFGGLKKETTEQTETEEITNIFKDSANSTLAASILRSKATLSNDWSEFSYDPEAKAPTLFITAPIFVQGKNVGFVSIQVDHNRIYRIINNFEHLGETGEIILGKAVDHNAIVVGPTRKSKKEGFKSLVTFKSKRELPLIQASEDQSGYGFYQDYVNDQVYGVWNFITALNLGIIVKKNVSEIMSDNPVRLAIIKLSYVGFMLAFLLLLTGMYGLCLGQPSPDIDKITWHATALKQFLQILTTGAGMAFILTLVFQLYTKYSLVKEAKTNEINHLTIAAEQLNHSLKTIDNIGHLIADDLQSGRVTNEELKHRLERDLNENQKISGISVVYRAFAFDRSQRLYAPYYYRKNGKINSTDLGTVIDYTKADRNQAPWFNLNTPRNGAWTQSYVDPVTQQDVVIFSVPFFNAAEANENKKLGIINIYYPIQSLRSLVNSYNAGASGYFFLLAKSGHFLSYPLRSYTLEHKTIYDLAQELEQEKLIELGHKIKKERDGFISFGISNANETEWIHFQSLNSAEWALVKVGVQEQIQSRPYTPKIDYEILFIEALIFSILAVTMLGRFYTLEVPQIRLTLGFITVVLLVFNLSLWGWVYFQEDPPVEGETVITDSVDLSLFMDEQNRRHELLFENTPVWLITGIYLNTLNLNSYYNTIDFNADVWQSILKAEVWKNIVKLANENVTVNFMLPQASRIFTSKVHESDLPDRTTFLYSTYAQLAQTLTYKAYPLDKHRLRIKITPKDITQNVLLVPSLKSYRYLDPYKTPGIAKGAIPDGFYLIKTFFAYNTALPNVNYGIETQAKSREVNTLSYIIEIKRNIMGSFITYILPLLIILILLFAVLILLHSMADRSLAAFAALMLTLVMLHRNLRSSLDVNEVLYMEYIFFSTYLIQLLLIIYTVILSQVPALRNPQGPVDIICVALFWPLNLLLWLLATLYVFFWS
jgi:hypothetical protein